MLLMMDTERLSFNYICNDGEFHFQGKKIANFIMNKYIIIQVNKLDFWDDKNLLFNENFENNKHFKFLHKNF